MSQVAPDALALAAIMAQPFEPMVLSGAVTPKQLQSNMEAVQLCERLKEDRICTYQFGGMLNVGSWLNKWRKQCGDDDEYLLFAKLY